MNDTNTDTNTGSSQPWNYDQVNGWYNKYLGHNVGGGWESWSTHPDAESAIQGSQEAKDWTAKQGAQPPTSAGLSNLDPGAATGAPSSYNSGPADPHVAQMIDEWIKQNNLQANQNDPNALHSIVQHLRQNGVDAQVDYQDTNGHTGGILVNGKPYQLINGSNQWTTLQPWQESGGASSAGGGGGTSSFTGSSGGVQPSPQSNQLMDLLMGRATQSLNIDPTTDPIIRPQVDNAAAQNERERRNYLNNLAESSNPYATGSLNTAATQTAEKAGQANANLQSQLVSNEQLARRTEIQNALSEMGSLLTEQERMALTQELGMIDANLRQQSINSGNDQFMASLGLQTTNQNNYWDAVRSGRF